MKYIILIILWTAWCTLHSALISLSVTEWLRSRVPGFFRYYRIIYNSISIFTLVPVIYYAYLLRGPTIISWGGTWQILRFIMIILAVFLFVAGTRRYDLAQFLGLRQVHDEKSCSVLTDDCTLDTKGILSIVRHPWYTGGLLIVWTRSLDLAGILTNLVVCSYFVIGAILEERKLVAQFGEEYRAYQQQVSMLFPVKRFLNKLKG